MSTAIATKTDLNTLRTMLEKAAPKLQEVAPAHLKVDRLVRLLLSAISHNPKILQCSQESILQFAMKCSETGLEPIGPGGMWAIPYENRKNNTVELQAIPDYRGLMHCAKRAGCIKDAFAEVVRENDEFDYDLGERPNIKVHKPTRSDRGPLQAAYCVVVMPDDDRRPVIMNKDEVLGIRDRAPAWQAWLKYKKPGPWNTDEAEMWKKTVVRRAMKPFTGASGILDAAISLDDEATGIQFQPDPVPMPRAIGEAPPAPPETADQRQPGDGGPSTSGDATSRVS